MKSLLLLSLCLVFVSCASTPPTQGDGNSYYGTGDGNTGQKEVNEAFEGVYNQYEQFLIMDGSKEYRVKYGDTLSSIAKELYGKDNGYYFPLIMLASSKTVLDPDLIEPGMMLNIPDLQRNLNESTIRGKLKQFFTEIADVYRQKNTATSAKTRTELLKIAESL